MVLQKCLLLFTICDLNYIVDITMDLQNCLLLFTICDLNYDISDSSTELMFCVTTDECQKRQILQVHT